MIRKTLIAAFGIAWMAAACTTMDAPQTDLASTEEIASTAQDISAACHVGNLGDDGYCTSTCKCGAGEGDCNSSTECLAGMKCVFNQGNNYGFPSGVDVCDCPANAENGGASFCSANCPCEEGQGDCDSAAECGAGMTCYTDAGGAFPGTGLDAEDDVCATCLPPAGNGTIDYCNASCTCSEGEGDCDSNTDCDAGLRCFLDVGADFGLPADTDVCAACAPDSLNGKFDFCSASCPCNHGQGDCDSNAECAPGLTCVNDVGATFGLPADTDVCVNVTP
jgi:hypothetical protein